MPAILINLPPHAVMEDDLRRIRELMPGYDTRLTQDKDEIASLRDEIEILAGWPVPDVLVSGATLRWYQQWSAGSDWLTRHPEAAKRPFLVTNASGVHPIQIAEHTFAMMLAFGRKLHEAVRHQAAREWKAPAGESLSELYEKTLLMVGLGAIGERIALVGHALGMRVFGMRRRQGNPPPGVEAVYPPDRLLEILPQCDFVVLAPPLTQETRGMIGERELRAMKQSAFLVNVGRGKLIDESALIRALRERWIAGAGLDVFETEPLPGDSPLWEMPNVIMTAHYAGASPRYYERAMPIFLDNLRRYRDGEELRNLVDKREATVG
jgi:phosphoglycerate dehydrogenase-like enzyme